MKIRFTFLLMMVGLIGTVSSCTQRSLSALNPCTINGVVQNVPVNPQRALDVLFVVDDSASMLEEQAKLAEQLPRLVSLLLSGGVDPSDGSTPVGVFPAVESLHVAVVTPDLGHSTDPMHPYTAGVEFEPSTACEENNGTGKNGFMQIDGFIDEGSGLNPCTAATPPADTLYLNRSDGTDAEFVRDVTCITGQTDGSQENAGCGFEQQLESILEQGRNGANAGFSREDALLAVILITDEDDCSTTDPRVFDIAQRRSDINPFQGPWVDETTKADVKFNLRCWEHGTKEGRASDPLQGIERYVNGIASLKADPSQVVFAAITGIPEDADLDRSQFSSDEARYDAILAHPGMVETPDPTPPPGFTEPQRDQRLTPACTAGAAGDAMPGRRIVETVKGLAAGNTGIGTVVESICADDYAPALNAIVDRIAAALRQLCLPRELNRNSQGLVGCEVREVQPEGGTCATAGLGREEVRVGIEDGREVCRVTQLPTSPDDVNPPAGLGWFYDDFTAETVDACEFNPTAQRVSFTEGAAPVAGARIRFECLQAAPPETEDVGWPCTGTGGVCDAASDNTGTACTTDGDCPNGACERVSDSMCDPNPDNCLPGEAVTTAECELDPANCCETRILKERYDRDNLELVCDTESNTCQLTCESNVECPGGFACYDESDDGTSYCVNPTCTLN